MAAARSYPEPGPLRLRLGTGPGHGCPEAGDQASKAWALHGHRPRRKRTVRVTSHGLIVVDSKERGDTIFDALMAQIRAVSNQPIKVAFLTHPHDDHAGNRSKYLDMGAQVIDE